MSVIRPTRSDMMIVVDVQNDFCPGGTLAVGDGHHIVPLVNRLMAHFGRAVVTQDWHTPEHASFAAAHPGRHPFETIEVAYGPQTLWPVHCVQGTHGADFHPDLDLTKAELVLRKGFDPAIDSYSAFFENDRTTPTGLDGYLRERGIGRVFLAGLATDYCVAYSALDAARLGFDVAVVLDACRGIDLDGSLEAALDAMAAAGISFISVADFEWAAPPLADNQEHRRMR